MKDDDSMWISVIRNLIPGIIAQDIVNAQPMSMGITPKFRKVNHLVDIPEGHVAVSVEWDVGQWIESTIPISEYKPIDGAAWIGTAAYIISEQAYTLLTLRWE